jgi:hypothetical protein
MPAIIPNLRIPALVGAARTSGVVIAAAAERYEGQGYVYGGNASRPGVWDCSSFVSYVLGHDLKLSLPGGKWGGPGMPPGSHGPVVTSYAAWQGATTVTTPQAGDLCCFVGSGPNGHIGIAISSREMVSALNPAVGTVRTPIAGYGPQGAPLIYRRVNGVAAGGPVPVGFKSGQAPPAGNRLLIGVLVALLVPTAAAGLLVLTGGVVVLAASWAAKRVAS